MDLGIRVPDVVSSMSAFLFPFWPFMVIAPIVSKGNVLVKMLVIWCALLLVRITLLFSTLPKVDFMIREPASTVLFLFVGGVLVFANVLRGLRRLA
jgi:hypothetical protein